MLRYLFFLLPFLAFGQLDYPDDCVGWADGSTFPSNYEVYIVTNFNDSGAGSFRDAVTSTINADGRVVVFNGLSGWIDVGGEIRFNQSKNIYIAGQTSDNGIGLRLDGATNDEILIISGGSAIVRALTIAPGLPPTPDFCCGDALVVRGGTRHYIDRNTFIWASDDLMAGINFTRTTFSRNLVAEGLYDLTTVGWSEKRAKASLFSNNADKVTLYRNHWASNASRNPLWGGGSPGPALDEMEMVQCYIYNWRDWCLQADVPITANISLINNYSDRGPNSSSTRGPWDTYAGWVVYTNDNYDDIFRPNPTDPQNDGIVCHESNTCGSSGSVSRDPAPASRYTFTPHGYPMDGTPSLTKQQIKDTVIAVAGDPNDAAGITSRLRNASTAGTGTLINVPSDVGGYPSIAAGTIITDNNNNGIPDAEEGVWGNDTYGYVNSLISGSSPSPSPTTRERVIKPQSNNIRGVNGPVKLIKN